MTFTHERATGVRRQHDDSLEKVMWLSDDCQEDAEADDLSRHGIREWFGSLAMGNLLGHVKQF